MRKRFSTPLCALLTVAAVLLAPGSFAASNVSRLFPTGLPYRQWTEFTAAGFSSRVCGTIYSGDKKPECGVPMGGIGTGCIDIEADGTLGYCTAFQPVWGHGASDDGGRFWRDMIIRHDKDTNTWPLVRLEDPSRGPLGIPFLGLAVGGSSWSLATTPVVAPQEAAKSIDYWGHYPIADMEFTLDGPVQVGLRAWSPFLPGDVKRSSVPGAVFEVHLRNTSTEPQSGKVTIAYPGLRQRETEGLTPVAREISDEGMLGLSIATPKNFGYVLAALRPDATSPVTEAKSAGGGASVVVGFQLAPGKEKVVRFVLAWYAPTWSSSWPEQDVHTFTRMYTTRFKNAVDVARYLAKNHESLLKSILSWQQVIYSDKSIPGWLRDGLINVLHLIPEESYWALAKDPIGNWCKPEDGVFSLVEGTDADGQQTCIPCDWYGNIPIVYFFPELAKSTLRALAYGQREDGCIPMTLGRGLDVMGEYQYEYQQTLNPCVYTDLVDRLWLRTGDDGIIKEFYPSVKKTTEFVVNLVPGENSVVTTTGQEWYEGMGIIGMSSHVAGVRLAHLKMAERMAENVGDKAFAKRCRQWYSQGKKTLEDRLWSKTHYLMYDDPKSGKISDLILTYQLDGEWMADYHGLPGIFRKDRVDITLATIKALCGASKTECGLVNVVTSDGKITTDFGARMGGYCTMPASVFITAMSYYYEGDSKSGEEIAYNCLNNVVNTQGMTWDMPNMVRGDSGNMRRIYGFDYYQCMSLWGLPAAVAGEDLKSSCRPGGLVDRVLKAAKE